MPNLETLSMQELYEVYQNAKYGKGVLSRLSGEASNVLKVLEAGKYVPAEVYGDLNETEQNGLLLLSSDVRENLLHYLSVLNQYLVKARNELAEIKTDVSDVSRDRFGTSFM